MSTKLEEAEIDKIVIERGDDVSAWGDPIEVKRKGRFPIILSETEEIIVMSDAEGGTPVFRGTEVPVSSLFENLEEGGSVPGFIKQFPTVKREQVIEVLDYFKSAVERIKDAA